jgi:hypothetical chaperone protein
MVQKEYHDRPFASRSESTFMSLACGIDFGTSNSTIGFYRPGQPTLLPLEDGRPTLPSVVFFNADHNTVLFGRAALTDYLAGHEGRLMRSLKSLLGTALINGQTEVDGRALPFRELLSLFMRELKRRAEQAAGQPFTQAVLGRPVRFVDNDDAADRLAETTLEEIARAAGFRDVLFQYEPIAAAFDYESRLDREELVLIADIGGGTSDFSLVRLAPERAKKDDRRDDILASAGVHISGTDFDKYLSLAAAMPMLGLGGRLSNGLEVPSGYYFNLATWHTINFAYSRKVWHELQDLARDACERDKLMLLLKLIEQRDGHWLAMQVEQGKIALSAQDAATLPLDRLGPDLRLPLQRSAFDTAISHLVDGIESTVRGMLAQTGLAADAVDTIFFTGGSSSVPLLRQRIAALLPSARRVEGDLFGSIGTGLALDAARRF